MQNKFSFRLPAIVFAALMITSCSKNGQTDQISSVNDQLTAKKGLGFDKTGAITGTLFPAVEKTTITIYDQVNSFGPYHPEMNGSFKIPDIPAGFYKMTIRYPAINPTIGTQTDYSTMTIETAVEAGSVTNMGVIKLQ